MDAPPVATLPPPLESPRLDDRPSYLAPRLLLAAAALPLAALVTLIALFQVGVPIGDEWTFVPTIQAALEGRPWLDLVVAGHNGHSLVFPEIVMVLLARASAWDLRLELATNVLLAVGILGVLHAAARRSSAELCSVHPLLPALSLVAFSLVQYENWLWGWQVQILMNVLAATAGLLVLATPRPTWRTIAGASALGIVATHSFGTGACFWPVGFLVLAASAREPRARARALVAFALVAALVGGAFVHQAGSAPHARLGGPAVLASYVFKYLGGSLVTVSRPGALVAGVLGTIAVPGLALALVRAGRARLEQVALPLGLALYAIASALVTAYARAGEDGSNQALSSRYTTLSSLLWAAALILGHRAVASAPAGRARPVAGAALATLIALLVFGELREGHGFVSHARTLARGRDALLAGDAPALAQRHLAWGLVTDDELRERLAYLRAHRLCGFGHGLR